MAGDGAPAGSGARDPWRAAARVLALACVIVLPVVVLAPWLRDPGKLGFHDWDAQTAHRYLVRLSLLRYRQLPWWNPFACGGFPAWGYVEGDTVLVSPFLPAYLALPIAWAIRVEVLGMALLGAAGAYAVASRFTKAEAGRALVVALWAVDGRWALQAAAGHTWHLAYALLPWCLYFLERARGETGRAFVRDLALLGASFAMLVYAGGIYPLPHTVLACGLYAALVAVAERSARPLGVLAAGGALGGALAAPKLLPMLDAFVKSPRLIESKETLDLGALWAMLTSRDQGFGSRPAHVVAYGWHEWGIYVSTIGVLLLLAAFVFVRGPRETALKLVAALFVLLGFGAFHPDAPWTWLHEHAPFFRSQHVPSRFLYPAVLLGAIVAAAGIGRLVDRRRLRAPWLDAALAACALGIGLDVAMVAQKPMTAAMWMEAPPIPGGRAFHFEKEPPFNYVRRDWAGPMYLAMLGNTGVLNCYGTPPFDRKGALASNDPRFHGEARLDGAGTAEVVDWSPNRVVVSVEGASPGELLVYNMNFDEGWSASPGTLENAGNALGVRLAEGSGRVVLTYRPPRLGVGLAVFLLAAGAIVVAWRRTREAA